MFLLWVSVAQEQICWLLVKGWFCLHRSWQTGFVSVRIYSVNSVGSRGTNGFSPLEWLILRSFWRPNFQWLEEDLVVPRDLGDKEWYWSVSGFLFSNTNVDGNKLDELLNCTNHCRTSGEEFSTQVLLVTWFWMSAALWRRKTSENGLWNGFPGICVSFPLIPSISGLCLHVFPFTSTAAIQTSVHTLVFKSISVHILAGLIKPIWKITK